MRERLLLSHHIGKALPNFAGEVTKPASLQASPVSLRGELSGRVQVLGVGIDACEGMFVLEQ